MNKIFEVLGKIKNKSNFVIPRTRGRARGQCNMTRQLEAT
jgi:hypothetical protein